MSEGTKFAQYVGGYFSACIVVFACLFTLSFGLQRRGLADRRDGLLIIEGRFRLVRGLAGLAILMLLFVPMAVIGVSLVTGPALAALEGWTFGIGIEFMMGNMLGLANPLTSSVPQTQAGCVFAYIFSIYAMLIGTSGMGLLAQMSLVASFQGGMSGTLAGLLKFLLLFVPGICTLLSIVTGGMMALAEDWTFADGFFYMAGQLSNAPLAETVPQSAAGNFVEVILVCLELSMSGAIIGVIGAHPIGLQLVSFIEGEGGGLEGEGEGEGKIEAKSEGEGEGEARLRRELEQAERDLERAQERVRLLREAAAVAASGRPPKEAPGPLLPADDPESCAL